MAAIAEVVRGTAVDASRRLSPSRQVAHHIYYDNLGGSEPTDAYDFYDGCGAGVPSAVDLFRYSSAGELVLDSSLSTTAGAYFSYNGGSTNGANGLAGTPKVYNTLDNGDDYADVVSSSPDCGKDEAIQDAEGCPGEDAGMTIISNGRH